MVHPLAWTSIVSSTEALCLALFSVAHLVEGGQQPARHVLLPRMSQHRLLSMCGGEGVSLSQMVQNWIHARWDAAQGEGLFGGTGFVTKQPKMVVALAPEPCPHNFDVDTGEGAFELLGLARAEIDCTEIFLRAVINYGRQLLRQNKLHSYDIMHEVIRAETGYRLAKFHGKAIDSNLFGEFLKFQRDLADLLQGWQLWEYEFTHWRYHKRPTGSDDYTQLYNSHRLPNFQHIPCPAVPLAYRMWSNFPTCPPSRLQHLPRFVDAYVSAMTVDNWRASYQDFLSEDYNYNVSFLAGGDPQRRLSKGAHSIFAGVFIQKLPTDLWCYQQAIHDLKPGYIIDLGSSQGGSAVWFASMLKLFELPGKVISIDLGQEQAYWLSKRRADEAVKRLKLQDRIDWNYVKDGSKNEAVRGKVERLCKEAPCMVVSDSDHDYEHTFWEIEWYAKHVGVGQYLVIEDTNIYGWNGWLNINDPNDSGLRKGPMEAANDFELSHRADFIRTDWCARHYGLSQTPNGWFFRRSFRSRGLPPQG